MPEFDPDPVYYPVHPCDLSEAEAKALFASVAANVTNVLSAGGDSDCTMCKSALLAAQPAARQAPSYVPESMVQLCIGLGLHSAETCEEDFSADTFGAI